MQFTKKEYKKFNKNDYSSFILGGDIGGTNAIFGVFGVKNKFPILILSLHFKSKELSALYRAINEVLNYSNKNYKIIITKASLAVAGVLSAGRSAAEMTNIRWKISKKELIKKTNLKKIILLNDFEAIGYGINMLAKKDVAVIKKRAAVKRAPVVVVGAGTGLGKATLIYDEHKGSYVPLHSEAGHSDFAAQNKFELELINFIKKGKKIKQNVSYEQVLSGQGLSSIYSFLRKDRKFKQTKHTKKIDNSKNKPELISKYRNLDMTCEETFKTFKTIYAKFAKNMALDALAFGGVYIAGGIAPKNRDIFDKKFVNAFEESHKMHKILKKIPIYLITNYNAGLLGAGFAGAKYL